MPPRRNPHTVNQATPPAPAEAAPAMEGAPAAVAVPRRRGRPPRQPPVVLPVVEPLPMPQQPLTLPLRPLDIYVYKAYPLAFIPAELPNPQEAEHENKIYVSRRTYEVLVGEDVPLLAVEIRSYGIQTQQTTVLATIEGTHLGEPNDVYLPHMLMERLGTPEHINLLLVRTPLPTITKVELRIMDNDFALEDPVEAIQDYLKNYYVLEEGTTLNITNPDMGITVPVYIEKIYPEPMGRIQNGEVELELLRIEIEKPVRVPSPPPPDELAESAPLGSAPLQLPMIPDYYPEAYQPKEPPKIPTQDEKEKIRLARLARFSSP